MRIAALLVVLLGAGVAHADGFTWRAPLECPTSGDVRERIDRRLGSGSIDEITDIDVLVTRDKRGFAAHILSLGTTGQGRSLEAMKCDELADAVAVVVARLATDARAANEVRSTRRKNDLAKDVVSTRCVFPDRHAERWNGGMRALALSGIGMTPHVGVGGDISGFVQRGNKFVEVGYARWVERPLQMFPGDNGSVELGTQLFAVRGGWASTRMPLRAWGGVETGTMHGVGATLNRQQPDGRWVALSAGFGVGWPMSPRTRLVGTFEVAAALQRATFTFMDGTEISEPAPLSARSAIGLEVAFR
jgi:hypothetical protein